MKFKTWLYIYETIELAPEEWIVRRSSWLWGIPHKVLNRYGELQIQINDTCCYTSEDVAHKRLVKYLKHVDLY